MNSQGAKGAVGGLPPMPARKEAESLWEANGGWEPEPPLHPHHLLVPLGQLHQYLLLSNLAALPYHLLLLPPPRHWGPLPHLLPPRRVRGLAASVVDGR